MNMHLTRIIAVTLLGTGLGLAAPATASAQAAAPAQASPEATTSAADRFDVGRLPISLERIHQALRLSMTREERDGLNLRYVVDVFGRAPSLAVFTKEDNLLTGPVPHGAPTHQEMIDHVTPREFRAPVADFNALFRWLAERARK